MYLNVLFYVDNINLIITSSNDINLIQKTQSNYYDSISGTNYYKQRENQNNIL